MAPTTDLFRCPRRRPLPPHCSPGVEVGTFGLAPVSCFGGVRPLWARPRPDLSPRSSAVRVLPSPPPSLRSPPRPNHGSPPQPRPRCNGKRPQRTLAPLFSLRSPSFCFLCRTRWARGTQTLFSRELLRCCSITQNDQAKKPNGFIFLNRTSYFGQSKTFRKC